MDLGSDGIPRCVILSGDNGSGKSSIVDGLEFALLGRLLRDPATPVALEHLGQEGGGEASARLANGDELTREVPSGIDVELGIAPHPAYALSPFILRRQDVAGFFEFDESERQLALSDFFRRDRGARNELQRAAP